MGAPGLRAPEVAELVDASAASTIVAQLASHYTFTVLDIEHHLTERALAALDVVDRVLLVTQLGVVPLRSTQRTLELFQRLGYPEDKLAVVVNRHQSHDVVSSTDAERLLGRHGCCTRFRTTRAPRRPRSRRVRRSSPRTRTRRSPRATWHWRPSSRGVPRRRAAGSRRDDGHDSLFETVAPREEMMGLSLRDRLLGRAAAEQPETGAAVINSALVAPARLARPR
jgi:hypothetical protein